MKISVQLVFAGMIFATIAALILYFAFNADVTVVNGEFRVANAQLMQIQLINFLIGLSSGLASVILFSAGAIVSRLEPPDPVD